MKVLLKADVAGTGKKGEVVEVSDGYARNFLFKRKLAESVNSTNLNVVKQAATAQSYHKEQERLAAQKEADKLNLKVVDIAVKVGDNGRLFGAVTSKEIAEAVSAGLGITVDKKKILLDENIKAVGKYMVKAKLYEGITAKFYVNVIGE
ncbi:MAG: 50S ribosomal protein L9 [Firmicutes bacterium]|nr:50S ribosomal protein L9 [Bacillota bacterium]